MRSEIYQCRNCLAVREQGFSVKVLKYLVGDAKAVCPDQTTVSFHAPAVGYVAADHDFAMGGTPQHKPLEGKQLRSREKVDLGRPVKTCPIEYDCFLRKPCKLGGHLCFQLGH